VSDINGKFSRRQFLAYQSIIDAGQTAQQAADSVASAATQHPEWNLDEEMTWAEWGETQAPRGRRANGDQWPPPSQ